MTLRSRRGSAPHQPLMCVSTWCTATSGPHWRYVKRRSHPHALSYQTSEPPPPSPLLSITAVVCCYCVSVANITPPLPSHHFSNINISLPIAKSWPRRVRAPSPGRAGLAVAPRPNHGQRETSILLLRLIPIVFSILTHRSRYVGLEGLVGVRWFCSG